MCGNAGLGALSVSHNTPEASPAVQRRLRLGPGAGYEARTSTFALGVSYDYRSVSVGDISILEDVFTTIQGPPWPPGTWNSPRVNNMQMRVLLVALVALQSRRPRSRSSPGHGRRRLPHAGQTDAGIDFRSSAGRTLNIRDSVAYTGALPSPEGPPVRASSALHQPTLVH
jgi:hypothetical protein